MRPCRLSIILINFNSSHYTLDCVKSIREKIGRNDFEIVVVDNCSADADYERLLPLQDQPDLKLVRSRMNLGFAGGNMFGVQFANPGSEYLFFLNNDCLFVNDAVSILLDYLDNNPEIAACTGQIYDGAGNKDQSFDYLPEPKTKLLGRSVARKLNPGAFPPIDGTYAAPIKVQVITGCAMMLRAAAFASIGGLDTNLFLYCEEEDLCKRLAVSGFGVGFVPAAGIIHLGGKSTAVNWETRKEFYISFFYYFRKYHSLLEVYLMRLLFFFKNFRKGFKKRVFMRLAFFILKGAPPGSSLRFRQRIH
jgi:GT2 family glycosyltransferase